MAIIKHIPSKNANYGNAIEYLTQKYDEELNKPILDENNCLQEREEYRIAYFDSSGMKSDLENWEKDCIKTNLKYGKNKEKNEIKSHQYVLAFEDGDNLTIDEVQRLTEIFALENFPGHQILVAAHPGHGHIVINSVRDQEREKEEWMQKYESGKVCRWEYAAGMKHHAGDDYMVHIKKNTMEFCKNRGLGQVELLSSDQKIKKTDKEYRAEKNAANKGKITYKEYIRRVIDEGKSTCCTIEEFHDFLKNNNVEHKKRGQSNNYKTIEGSQWIREKSLGESYKMDSILKSIEENYKRSRNCIVEFESAELQNAIENAKKEGIFRLSTHKNKKGVSYQVGLYNEDGTKRTAIECVIILAIAMISGEIPESSLPKWQQYQNMKGNNISSGKVVSANKKIKELNTAIVIANELNINTFEDLQENTRNSSISKEDRKKLAKLKKTLLNALNKEYCTYTKNEVLSKQKEKLESKLGSREKQKSRKIQGITQEPIR